MKLNEFIQSENPVQCSCCDYFSLAERGKCQVCPVCFWEDDCMESSQPELDNSSDLNNDMTLRQARDNFKKFGVFDPKWESIVISADERETLTYSERSI